MTDSAPIEVDELNFDEVVLQSPVPTLVDFWGPRCGPCKMLAPVLDEIAKENAGTLRIAKINAESNIDFALKFGVRAVPTMQLYAGGELKETIVGAGTGKQALVSKLKALAA